MMARFDVYRNRAGSFPPYLLQLQSELHDELHSCVVAPIVPGHVVQGKRSTRLMPEFIIMGEKCTMLTQELTSLPRRYLGEEVASLQSYQYEITDAVDFLMGGF